MVREQNQGEIEISTVLPTQRRPAPAYSFIPAWYEEDKYDQRAGQTFRWAMSQNQISPKTRLSRFH